MSETTTLSDADASVDGAESSNGIQLEDLHKAVLVLKHLRKENRQLSKNFENLKGVHLTLVTSHRKLELEHEQLKQERVSVEQQYQQLCESWRAELEEKQHQFEQAAARILEPRDLDLLKVQLLEEVEAPFKAKCEAIAKEAEAAQKQFVQLRREHEALQNSIRSQELLRKGGVDVLQGQYDALQHALGDKVSALEATTSKVQQLEQQLRHAQQHKEDATMQLHFLREESLELRKAKEAAVMEKEQLTIRLERRNQQLQSELKELQSLAESLTRKNRHLADELKDSNRAQDAAHTQLMSLQASNMSLSSQLTDAQTALKHERQLQAEQIAAAERQWQERINELLGQVLDKEKQIAHLVQSHEQTESAAADQLTAMQESAAAKQREAVLQVEDLKQQLATAEKDIADLRVQSAEAHSSANLEKVAMLQTEVTQLRCELQDSQQQLKSLQQQMADVAGQQQAIQNSYQTLEAAGNPGLAARVQSETRSAMLELRVQQLEQQLSDANAQLNNVRQQHEQLQREADKRVAAAKQAAAADRDTLGAKHATKVRKLQEAAKDQIRMLRSKLRDSRATVQDLQSEISNLKISLHEKEAEVVSWTRSSMERPTSPGSPGRWMYDSPSRLRASGGPHSPPAQVTLAAAIAGVRHRQQQYLQGASQSAAE